MRNIIFTSILSVLAYPVAADAPLGCFSRTYSDSHLAKNPEQIVRSMALEIYKDPTYGDIVASMGVEFADQGRIKNTASAGQFMDQYLVCWEQDGTFGCSVECDGGVFSVSRRAADSITIATEGLVVGEVDGCGGAESIAEVFGKVVKYKLYKAEPAACVWN